MFREFISRTKLCATVVEYQRVVSLANAHTRDPINRLTLSDVIRSIYFWCRAVARLGDLDLDPEVEDGATPLDVPIDRVITHERYLYGEKHINDIALLVLQDDVTFTSKCFARVFNACLGHVSMRVPYTKRVIFFFVQNSFNQSACRSLRT